MTTNSKSAIVWIVDRLGARFLSPYGNAGIDTPHANRLAAESLVIEQAQIDSPFLAGIYRSYWHGLHAIASPSGAPASSLPQLLNSAGVPSILVSDDREVLELPAADHFSRREFIQLPEAGRIAADMEETHLARFTAAVLDLLDQLVEPFFLWVHSRGMSANWDAPYELRESLGSEDDPPPPKTVEVPSQRLAKDYDPDELLGIVQAYSGQVMLWDMCLGAVSEALVNRPAANQTLFSLTSPRGFPLGEHLGVGPEAASLYGELIHVPWLVRSGDLTGASLRTRNLVQPSDMFATLVDWFEIPSGAEDANRNLPNAASLLSIARSELNPWPRDRALTITDQEVAIRVENWFLKLGRGEQTSDKKPTELYRKPEDLWEVNEVSDRAVHIAALLREVVTDFETCSTEPSRTPAPLADELLD